MHKAMGTTFLALVFAVGMLTVLGMSSEANSAVILISLTPVGGDIEIDKKFVGVCKGNNPKCTEANHILWTVQPGTLNEGERLIITNVPTRIACFPDIPIEFTHQTGVYPIQSSGEALDHCTWDKYGVYWPYIVEIQQENPESGEWETVKSTDPGGVIFP